MVCVHHAIDQGGGRHNRIRIHLTDFDELIDLPVAELDGVLEATATLQHPRAALFMLGGRIFKHSAVTCGAAAVEAAQYVSADLCFIGVTGVHPEAGLTTGDAEDAAMKRALAARAAETYIFASSEKMGTASPYRVLPWSQISGVITDASPANAVIKEVATRGVEILSAGVNSPDGRALK